MPRTKGATDIPPRKKARILAKKNTKEYDRTQIARSENVSLATVDKVTPESVPPEVLEWAERYEKQFLAYAQANALKAQHRTFNTIDELTADKAAVVAEKNFNMSQIIQNRATSIVDNRTESPYEKIFNLMKGFYDKCERKPDADYLFRLYKHFYPSGDDGEVWKAARAVAGEGEQKLLKD